MENTTSNKSFELIEAAGATVLREAATAWVRRRLFGTPKPGENTKCDELDKTLTFVKIGFLDKGTKTPKMSNKDKGTIKDIVAKAFNVHETTKGTEPVKIITLNERIGLTNAGEPLDHANRVERCFGAICTALIEMLYPDEPNKAGKVSKTRENIEARKAIGFTYWNAPLYFAKRAAANIAPKVTFSIDAFELPKPPKSDKPRVEYRAVICTKAGKDLKSLKCSKSDYENFRAEAPELTIRFITVDPLIEAETNKTLKAIERDKNAEADERTKEAILTEALEDAESFFSTK